MKPVRWTSGLAVGVAVALLAACRPDRLSAQSDPQLQEAIKLAQYGRGDSARAMVRRLLATLSPSDSLYAEALYTAGVIAYDTISMRRVVVEYGWSPWADDALLWLIQLHFAQGDPAATLRAVERLRRDYPDSPVGYRAAFWGARASFDLRDEARGCALIREALDGTGEDIEFRNQASYYAARCPAPPPPPPTPGTPSPGSGDTAATPAVAAPAPAAERPSFTVQVLAVRSAAQVDEMLTRLKVMGFPARVVRDTSGLLKVRVGRFATREEAQLELRRLKTRLGGQPFVVEEP